MIITHSAGTHRDETRRESDQGGSIGREWKLPTQQNAPLSIVTSTTTGQSCVLQIPR